MHCPKMMNADAALADMARSPITRMPSESGPDDQVFVQTRCPHCSGSVEFESFDEGRVTECPHCGQGFVLSDQLVQNASGRRETSASGEQRRGNPVTPILLLLLALSCVFSGALFFSRRERAEYLNELGEYRAKKIVAKEAPIVAGTTRYYLVADDSTFINVDVVEYGTAQIGNRFTASTNRWKAKTSY